MDHVILNNGVKMPLLGFGVYQIPKEDCERCVLDAISIGYRLIDTAQSYFNEEAVGSAIEKCGVPREELFITTKVWIDNYGYEKTKKSVLESMRKLRTGYLDLVLLHQPFGNYYGAYHALEDLYKEGKIRAIGVSNFYPDRLSDIAAFNEIVPQVNQVETNPLNQQIKAQENMVKNGVQIEAWAPFGEGRNGIFENQVLKEIAEKHNKSVAQVILRWLIQRKVVALAKSTHKERIQENFEVFDFELTAEDMEAIKALDTGKSLFFSHQDTSTVDLFVELIKKRRDLM
ncbi:aldo/keto reductase [Youngiibacter multivorans]|uniref:Diketogulonate reductase-like aldo/keto reductase n=1 Tax=Youngiibacter multivorans TaxID=937251 RepID=A0ABS4G8D9_9CLOT|nr:aldo/keto reductase [Youngiibacter multivorans]MBP1920812.1 diketogulonate reductase-like aldo/keto reductase [Youngiibacter multivorans]